jgi:tetratricopeptide (TPR) repeat protein
MKGFILLILGNLTRICVAFGLILLIVAANIGSPPEWLLLVGWFTLGFPIAMYVTDEVPDKSPYKTAMYLMILPLFLYVGIWGPGLKRPLFALLGAPSIKHLINLVNSRSFLALAVLYLVCVCFAYGRKIQGRDIGEDYDEDDPRCRKGKIAFGLGQKAFREKNMEEALEYFDQAIQGGFSREGIYGFRGSCLQTLDFHFDAIDDFNKGLSLDPIGDSNLYYMRSVSRRATGDNYGCIADLKEAIRLSKGSDKLGYAQERGWDSVSSFYESQISWAVIDLDEPAELLGRRLRGNLKRRMALDLPALPEPLA